VLAAAGSAKTVDEALSAGGTYLQSSTNPDIAQYLFYKQSAETAGQTPISFDAYQKQQASIADTQAYNKAFATAKGSAAGAAAAAPIPTTTDVPGTGLGGTSGGGSILSATGLSVGAFNFLTQGTASMSRMPIAQRTQIMNEAQSWLNKNGIDISTFQSQYKAYNDVLQKNIARANQTKIMAGEVSGSADALLSVLTPDQKQFGYQVVGGKLGNLSSANVLDLLAGKQVNSAFAQKYSFQIKAMANDLAGYFAASRGAPSPELQDQRDAADVISNGMNATSVQAFKDSVNANEEKVAGVVNNSVTSTQKQVWNLFGVQDQYKSPINTTDQALQTGQQTQQTINSYVTAHPDQAQNIANLYTQNYTDEQVAEYLQLQ
jgi:hypothetical protein